MSTGRDSQGRYRQETAGKISQLLSQSQAEGGQGWASDCHMTPNLSTPLGKYSCRLEHLIPQDRKTPASVPLRSVGCPEASPQGKTIHSPCSQPSRNRSYKGALFKSALAEGTSLSSGWEAVPGCGPATAGRGKSSCCQYFIHS